MTAGTAQEAAPIAVTPAMLTEALHGFYLTIRGGSRQHKGQVDDPAGVADALHATLSRIAAERPPETGAGMPSWVTESLDDAKGRKLIESWQSVPGRGIVVIGGDMAETELRSEHDAKLFLAGISSALTAFHDGEAAPDRDDAAARELAALKAIHDREWHALWVMVREAGGSMFIPEGHLSAVPPLASLGMALEPGGMRINASEEP